MAMESRTLPRRLRKAIAAVSAAVVCVTTMGQATADAESPFGDAAKVADTALDTMRGGFADGSGGMVRFAVDLTTAVNGKAIASLSVSNDDHGRIHASARNAGRTFVLLPDGSVQIKPTAQPSNAPPMTVSTQQNGTSSVTVATTPGNNTRSQSNPPVIVTTTLTPALPSTVTTGGLLATTGLLPNGNGVITLIQNTQSNAVIRVLQTLDIHVSGLGSPLFHRDTALRSFTNSMNFSVRR